MTLIDGDRIVTAQLYDDEYEEFIEKQMSIIDFVDIYTNEGVTTADDVLDKIRTEIKGKIVKRPWLNFEDRERDRNDAFLEVLDIIDKYMSENDHKCHNCKHYVSGQRDGSCGSYICKNYSDWESEE